VCISLCAIALIAVAHAEGPDTAPACVGGGGCEGAHAGAGAPTDVLASGDNSELVGRRASDDAEVASECSGGGAREACGGGGGGVGGSVGVTRWDVGGRGGEAGCAASGGGARSTLWPLLTCGDVDAWLRAARAAALRTGGPVAGAAAAAAAASRGGGAGHVVSTAPDGADALIAVEDAVTGVTAAGAHARDGAFARAHAALLAVARGALVRAGAGGGDARRATMGTDDAHGAAGGSGGGGGGVRWPCWLACAAMDAAWRAGDAEGAAAAAHTLQLLPTASAGPSSAEGDTSARPPPPVNAFATLLAAYSALDSGAGAQSRALLLSVSRAGGGGGAPDQGDATGGGSVSTPVASFEELPDGAAAAIASCVLRVLRTAPGMRSGQAHAACGADVARAAAPHATATALVALYHGPISASREAVGAWLDPIVTVLQRAVWSHAASSCELAAALSLGVVPIGRNSSNSSSSRVVAAQPASAQSAGHNRRQACGGGGATDAGLGEEVAARACVDALPTCADASLIAAVVALRQGRRAEAVARSRRARTLALAALSGGGGGRGAGGACGGLDARLADALAAAFWSATGEPPASSFSFSMRSPALSDVDHRYSIAVASASVEAAALGGSPAVVDRLFGVLAVRLSGAAAPNSALALVHGAAGWWYLRHADGGGVAAAERVRSCEHFERALATGGASFPSAVVGRAFAVCVLLLRCAASLFSDARALPPPYTGMQRLGVARSRRGGAVRCVVGRGDTHSRDGLMARWRCANGEPGPRVCGRAAP
jgi:hypothetical protein